jgi:predicted TIM-barrel fold metal-dependent hydrolase
VRELGLAPGEVRAILAENAERLLGRTEVHA